MIEYPIIANIIEYPIIANIIEYSIILIDILLYLFLPLLFNVHCPTGYPLENLGWCSHGRLDVRWRPPEWQIPCPSSGHRKIICFYGQFSIAMLNHQRVYRIYIYICYIMLYYIIYVDIQHVFIVSHILEWEYHLELGGLNEVRGISCRSGR